MIFNQTARLYILESIIVIATPSDCHPYRAIFVAVQCEWCRLQLKCDGTGWRTGGEGKGKLANVVDSQYPSHYLGTWCITTGDAHTSAVSSRLNWMDSSISPRNEIWFLRVCHHISSGLYQASYKRVGYSYGVVVQHTFWVMKASIWLPVENSLKWPRSSEHELPVICSVTSGINYTANMKHVTN